MKTLINITFIGGNFERQMSFVRAKSKRPTYRGAARMVAAKLNQEYGATDYPPVTPSDISVCRVEIACYA